MMRVFDPFFVSLFRKMWGCKVMSVKARPKAEVPPPKRRWSVAESPFWRSADAHPPFEGLASVRPRLETEAAKTNSTNYERTK